MQTHIGITYSFPYARWLFGNDSAARQALQDIADLGVSYYRLVAYWDQLQPDGPEQLNIGEQLEWQLDITHAARANRVVLCVGRKVLRWPEYYIPTWAQNLSEAEQQRYLLYYLSKLIDTYAHDNRITHWQVENEIFFDFGSGKPFSNQEHFLQQEVELIRAHDPLHRPTIITESGDKGNWEHVAAFGDILGVSFYGISNNGKRYIEHNNGRPKDWKKRAAALGKPVWLTELQAEPWGPTDNKQLSYSEALKSMNPDRLKAHLQFVTDAGFQNIYLWGTEWWLWMKEQGHPEMWEAVKLFIHNPSHV